jgi:uncharacterized protein (TIGR02217 family)
MTTFIESPRFPEDISATSIFGPGYSTSVVTANSGAERRNQAWSYPRHRGDVAYGIKTLARLENLLSFFHVVAGKAIGFRYKDWGDFKSCGRDGTIAATDCTIGTGTGALAAFQLIKTYTQGSYTRSRKILKPIASTVLIAVAGTTKTVTTHYTLDAATGIVTFTGGNLPTAGQAVTAGFEFDVPCRFDTDYLPVNLEHYKAGSVQVPLIELKYGDT